MGHIHGIVDNGNCFIQEEVDRQGGAFCMMLIISLTEKLIEA